MESDPMTGNFAMWLEYTLLKVNNEALAKELERCKTKVTQTEEKVIQVQDENMDLILQQGVLVDFVSNVSGIPPENLRTILYSDPARLALESHLLVAEAEARAGALQRGHDSVDITGSSVDHNNNLACDRSSLKQADRPGPSMPSRTQSGSSRAPRFSAPRFSAPRFSAPRFSAPQFRARSLSPGGSGCNRDKYDEEAGEGNGSEPEDNYTLAQSLIFRSCRSATYRSRSRTSGARSQPRFSSGSRSQSAGQLAAESPAYRGNF